PSLPEYLEACTGRGMDLVLVDVKKPTPDALRSVIAIVRSSQIADVCVVMVRTPDDMLAVREHDGSIRLGCFGIDVTNVGERVAAARTYGAELLMAVHGDHRYLSHRGAIAEIQAAGLS